MKGVKCEGYMTPENKAMKSNWKIFFAESIGGGRKYKKLYGKIEEQLRKYGVMLSQFGGDPDADGYMEKNGWTEKQLHDEDFTWLAECDVLVAECSNPSLGVGYEIARAVDMNKKILILCLADSKDTLPSKIRGIHNGTTRIVRDYQEDEISYILWDFFSKL